MAENKSSEKRTEMRGPRGGPGGHGGMRIEKAKDVRGTARRLLGYLSPHKPTVAVILVLVVLYTILSLIGPYLMGVAIDNYIANKDLQGLATLALLMLGAFLAAAAFQAISGFVVARVTQKILHRLRKELFGQIQTLSLNYFDRNPAGELMSRLTNDIDAINQAVSQNISQLITSVLSVFGILIMMLVLNVWLTLASLLVFPLIMFITVLIAKYTRTGFRDLQATLGRLNATMEETISGQRVVNAFRQNKTVINNFRRENTAAYDTGLKAQTFAGLLMPVTGIMGNLSIAVIAGFGGFLALQGLISVGMIATFISYNRQFIQPARQMAQMYNTVQAALAGAERIFEILDTQPELVDAPGARELESTEGHVIFKDVDFSYLPGIPVIKNMSLEAKPGQTIALVGPTGAGKTTIVNLLSRFYDIDDGCISIDGNNISELKKDSLRRNLGVVLQDTYLFAIPVIENIRYGRLEATDEECFAAAALAEADHFIRRLPDGYDTVLQERGSNLSQGQRQMLAIARAILADPAILILDEATSSVDTRTETRIQRALLRLMEGRTSFVIAHRLSTIREADQILVIDEGEVVESGSHAELLDKQGFFHQLYMSQYKGHAI
jgi:ATP-binding cassette, subfamily B, multidrug efflux pump